MNQITDHPATSGLQLERFTVRTAEGLLLEAMLVEPGPAAGLTKRGLVIREALRAAHLPTPEITPRGTVVLLHGFNARKEHMLSFAERLTAAGLRCVLYDSRGHGDSGGTYATFGFREIDDLHRVLDATRKRVGASRLGEIRLLGYSMGGAVAIQAQPSLPEVKAVAAVAAFADFREVIVGQAARKWHGLGQPLLPLIRWETRWRAGFDPWEIRPEQAARKLTCPLFLAHGTADALVPINQIHRLAAAAGTQAEEVLEIRDGTHGNVFTTGGDRLWGKLVVFFARKLTK